MSDADLTKALWDLSNAIVAFTAVQGLLFAYACAKKETGDILNKKALKLVLAAVSIAITIGVCGAVAWCAHTQCVLDTSHCVIYRGAAGGRLLCVISIAIFNILILYARQLFSRQPFDA
jgi:hypothetical protein